MPKCAQKCSVHQYCKKFCKQKFKRLTVPYYYRRFDVVTDGENTGGTQSMKILVEKYPHNDVDSDVATLKSDVDLFVVLDSSWVSFRVLRLSKAQTVRLHNQPRAFTVCPHENGLWILRYLSHFQLQLITSFRERPLRATWATSAAPRLPTAAVREPALLFVTERGFSCGFWGHEWLWRLCSASFLGNH